MKKKERIKVPAKKNSIPHKSRLKICFLLVDKKMLGRVPKDSYSLGVEYDR